MQCISFSSNTTWNLYNFRSNLIRQLVDNGYHVVTLSPRDSYSRKLAELGCQVIHIPMDNKGKNPAKDLQTYLAFKKAYKNIRPDVALHYTIKPNVYGTMAAKGLGIPTISTISGLGTAFLEDTWLTRLVEQMYRTSQKWPEVVFFQNKDDYKLFKERGLIEKSKMECVAGSGVDLSSFIPSPWPENSDVVFLFLGRLLLDKGINEYVQAAHDVKKLHPEARFQLLGPVGVSNRSAIKLADIEEWQSTGVIEYLGEADDVRQYIAGADCIVLPSYREGTPKTLLEAAAMSRPIITTDVPGCREVVNDAINGFFCQPRDVDSLVAQMQKFLGLTVDERKAMGVAGRSLVEKKFDEKKVIARYMQAISDAIS